MKLAPEQVETPVTVTIWTSLIVVPSEISKVQWSVIGVTAQEYSLLPAWSITISFKLVEPIGPEFVRVA